MKFLVWSETISKEDGDIIEATDEKSAVNVFSKGVKVILGDFSKDEDGEYLMYYGMDDIEGIDNDVYYVQEYTDKDPFNLSMREDKKVDNYREGSN